MRAELSRIEKILFADIPHKISRGEIVCYEDSLPSQSALVEKGLYKKDFDKDKVVAGVRELFRKEYFALKQLYFADSARIVKPYALVENANGELSSYLMQYVEGRTLRYLMSGEDLYPNPRCAYDNIRNLIESGYDELSDYDLVNAVLTNIKNQLGELGKNIRYKRAGHGDIFGRNIMVQRNGNILLIDPKPLVDRFKLRDRIAYDRKRISAIQGELDYLIEELYNL